MTVYCYRCGHPIPEDQSSKCGLHGGRLHYACAGLGADGWAARASWVVIIGDHTRDPVEAAVVTLSSGAFLGLARVTRMREPPGLHGAADLVDGRATLSLDLFGIDHRADAMIVPVTQDHRDEVRRRLLVADIAAKAPKLSLKNAERVHVFIAGGGAE